MPCLVSQLYAMNLTLESSVSNVCHCAQAGNNPGNNPGCQQPCCTFEVSAGYLHTPLKLTLDVVDLPDPFSEYCTGSDLFP